MAGDFADEEETLLTLCTCTYEMPDARLVVVARPMRENESEQADPVTVNPEPLLPLRWPRMKGPVAIILFKHTRRFHGGIAGMCFEIE